MKLGNNGFCSTALHDREFLFSKEIGHTGKASQNGSIGRMIWLKAPWKGKLLIPQGINQVHLSRVISFKTENSRLEYNGMLLMITFGFTDDSMKLPWIDKINTFFLDFVRFHVD